jgi:hypothetical protein
MTHGALVPDASKFTYYDEWELWAGHRGDLKSGRRMRDHVALAVKRAHEIGAQLIAPTITLSRPTGRDAEVALELAAEVMSHDSDAYIGVAGNEEFWSAGSDLDAYIGELAGFTPPGFSVTVVRPTQRYPWLGASADETYGICRSVHSLSFRGARVIASYSDFAGLPAVAAGAERVGSGWNISGRQFSYDSFRERERGGGASSYRPTYQGLLAALKRGEAESFQDGDPVNSAKLFRGRLPAASDKNGHWQHHLSSLNRVIEDVAGAGERDQRGRRLLRLYADGSRGFAAATAATGSLDAGSDQWITPMRDGLRLWMDDEGY